MVQWPGVPASTLPGAQLPSGRGPKILQAERHSQNKTKQNRIAHVHYYNLVCKSSISNVKEVHRTDKKWLKCVGKSA